MLADSDVDAGRCDEDRLTLDQRELERVRKNIDGVKKLKGGPLANKLKGKSTGAATEADIELFEVQGYDERPSR